MTHSIDNSGCPPIVVTGFGRCGSSMMMQMLRAAGIKWSDGTIAPSGEHLGALTDDWEWIQAGTAIKLIDFHLHYQNFPWNNCKFIIMQRDSSQQAASMYKMILTQDPFKYGRIDRRAAIRGFKKKINTDWLPLINAVGSHASTRCIFSFEDIIKHKYASAMKLMVFLGTSGYVNHVTDVVIDRNTNCYDGFMEYDLIAKATSK